MRLERSIVVNAALKLLNEVGMDGLTTRRLAEDLGVQGPALYWHFKNKQELIDEMARALLTHSYGRAQPGQDWADWLAYGARRLRRAMLSYRDGARLMAGYRPSGDHGRLDPEVMFGPLFAAGFCRSDCFWAVLTVGQFTFGWTMDEQAALERGRPSGPWGKSDEGFEFGLGAIIAGLKVRLAQSPGGVDCAPLASAPQTLG